MQQYVRRRGFADGGKTFQALGIHFVSLSESLDTPTPAGKMVFTVLGAVAELERLLIVERVKAGKAKGKRLGRPKVSIDSGRIVKAPVCRPV
jgi:DNA invertase Pin-like site-specific DNA recombinase